MKQNIFAGIWKNKNKWWLAAGLFVLLGTLLSGGEQDVTKQPETSRQEVLQQNAATALEVHFIDVGQGDATLIKSDGHYMLIDAGDNSHGTAVQLYLRKQGVEKLDYLVLTHTDADHIGGADVVVTKFDVDNIFLSDFEKDNSTYEDLVNAIDYRGMRYSTPSVGEEFTFGDASFTILAPGREYEDANNGSLALLLRNGENTFVFTGDCEEEAEKDILATGIAIDCDVYKAGHHGSKVSSGQDFLEAMSPTYVVISCEAGNAYGHPHAATLNKLRDMGIQVFRTDEQGSVIAYSDGKDITWNCMPSRSWLAGEPMQSGQSSGDAQVNQTKVPGTEMQFATTYICNQNTLKFHYPTCPSVDDMAESNKLPVTWSREEVVAGGYVPCGRCKP